MNNIEKFKNYYKEEKEKINEKLNIFNKKLIEEDNNLIKENLILLSNLNSDGKMIRGILVNLGYSLLKDNIEYSHYLSLAYEMFQTSILVHDDIIDNDSKRRGKDTIHYSNYNLYKKYGTDKECDNISKSIAICMGDYGLYQANQLITEYYKDDPNLAKVLINFNNTVQITIKGELIDVILPFKGKYNLINNKEIEENIIEIYRLKTAYYTIIGPLSVGILLAGGKDQMLEDIKKFGEKVGIAFQLQDDILAIFSDKQGKIPGSDIKEFKQTILYSHIINTEYKDEFMKYYGKEDLTEEDITKVQELLRKSSSLQYATELMNNMYDESLEILNNISWIKEDKKELLQGFVEYLRNRNK